MKHVEANIQIYFTREYSRFSNITGNRLLNNTKIKRMIRDIQAGFDMLRYCPIIVDKSMRVIDGQHRLHVARKVGSNIWYVIADDISLYEIAKLNSNTDKWSMTDFLNCYVTLKRSDYLTLNDFIKKHCISIGIALDLLEKGKAKSADKGAGKDRFRSGAFKVEHLSEAESLMELSARFQGFEFRKHRDFLSALLTLQGSDKCDLDFLHEKYESKPELLTFCRSPKEYLVALENVYNHGSKKRKVIY